MFVGTFAWSFVYVSLPFHIQAMSPLDARATLRWTGWILGVSSIVTVLTAPLWGRLAETRNPKVFYVWIEVFQGVAFLGMALARTLVELLLARFALGFMGAASTFAFMIAGRAAGTGALRRHVAAVQSAMTVGQVVGPLAGAIAAAHFGFRASFVVGSAILLGCALFVRWGVPDAPPETRAAAPARPVSAADVARTAAVVLGGFTQVFFLVAVLPALLPALGVAPGSELLAGGLLIFVSGAAAALGALLAPRLGDLDEEPRLVAGLLLASSVLLALEGLTGSAWIYGALRFAQVLAIAPVFPLVVTRIAESGGGQAIGFVNAARIGAAFLGPVVGTSILSVAGPGLLHLVLAAAGALCVPVALGRGVSGAAGERSRPAGATRRP